MHHKIQVLAKKDTYIIPSYRSTTFFQKIFAVSLENPFQKNFNFGDRQWQKL